MIIKEIINSQEKKRYSELAHEIGNIFNTLEWLDIFEDRVKLFGIYEKSGELVGGFNLYEIRKFNFKIYLDPPFTPCIGPIFRIEAKNPVSIMNRWKEAITLMAETIDSLPYAVVSVSLNKGIIDTQPFIWKKFKVTPSYTYILDLNKSIEEIYQGMSAVRRNDIRKAIRDGLVIKQVDDFGMVKSLILKTFSRQKMTVNKYHLDKILFEFANKENSLAFITFDREKPIAAAFCLYDKDTAYYFLGGYDYESKHHGAGALAVWEAIKYSKNLGLEYFDFEGSMVPQIERYFRVFGGNLFPYYRINKAKLLIEILLKFIKRQLF